MPNATSYVWYLPTSATGTSTTNSITVNYGTSAVSGNIIVKGHNSCGDGATSNLAITVNPLPQTPTITLYGDTLTSDAANGNQWYNTSSLINGANDSIYIPLVTGNYFVIVTDSNGCVSDSSNLIYILITGLTDNASLNNFIQIYPNPIHSKIFIESENNFKDAVITLYNTNSQILLQQPLQKKSTEFDISGFNSGIYFVKIQTKENVGVWKVVKE